MSDAVYNGQPIDDKSQAEQNVNYAEIPINQQNSSAYDPMLKNAHVAPTKEQPNCLVKCFDWMPLRWFLLLGGFILISFSVLDMALFGRKVKGIGNFIFFCVLIAGILIVIMEGPVTIITRRFQLGLYFWFRILSRLWGRAWFYLFISLLCFGQSPFITATTFGGFYLICWVPIMFVVSRNAARKYQRMFVFVSAGAEGQERDLKFAHKFDELDLARRGFIESTALSLLAAQAGRRLSNAEIHSIQTFLDVSCNGKISREDFIKQFRDHNLKQRFL